MSEKSARRLVVIGHDGKGRSRFALDTIVSGDEAPGAPGHEVNVIWGADDAMHYPDQGAKPQYATLFPPIGGCRLVELYIPPGGGTLEETNEGSEIRIPEQAMQLDADRPGMHRTTTMDIVIVMQGRCILELDVDALQLVSGQPGPLSAKSR